MLSYQHAYHAGNPADVLKHLTLTLVIKSLLKKDTPFHFYDTHAGSGLYDLSSAFSQKTKEAESGIVKLFNHFQSGQGEIPELIIDWLESLQRIRTTYSNPQLYPGSPGWVQDLMRQQDRATLLELHPSEFLKLASWARDDSRIKVYQEDSFQNFKRHIPPTCTRGVVLIDPPYELKTDYQASFQLLVQSLKRFGHGVYLLWYPIVRRGDSANLIKEVLSLQNSKILHIEIRFTDQEKDWGMEGTGLLVLNAPWKLDEQINSILPWLSSFFSE